MNRKLALISFIYQAKFWSTHAAGKTALLVVDVQNCFCEADATTSGEEGSLSVANTASVITVINDIRQKKGCIFDSIVRSQDYHPPYHISFGPTHGLAPFSHFAGKGELPIKCVQATSALMADASCCPTYYVDPSMVDCETQLCPGYVNETVLANTVLKSPACSICRDRPEECFDTSQAMWTNHCLQDGDASFPEKLITADSDIIVRKGGEQFVDAYSAFADNTKRLYSPLDGKLKRLDIETLYIVGIATDYCVFYSAMDAIELGYKVKVVLDATRGINEVTIDAAIQAMTEAGVEIINSTDVIAMECPEVEDVKESIEPEEQIKSEEPSVKADLKSGVSFLTYDRCYLTFSVLLGVLLIIMT